jgi:uracil-DNA glycosylase
MKLLELYESVISCPKHCNGIVRDSHTNVPRGFFTLAQPGDEIDLLVVAQNPGQPMSRGGEANLYRSLQARAGANTHLEFVGRCFFTDEGKTFHKRLVEWLAELFNVNHLLVFHRVVYTNAVKCTTAENRVPTRVTVQTCVALHLKREIQLWKPTLVVGLGRATQTFLRKCGIQHEPLPHPSHRRGRGSHLGQLHALRAKLEGLQRNRPA